MNSLLILNRRTSALQSALLLTITPVLDYVTHMNANQRSEAEWKLPSTELRAGRSITKSHYHQRGGFHGYASRYR